MGFCPECGREFSDPIVACRDCRASLVDDPRAAPRVAVALVALCEVSGVVEGSMWKGALESQGLHPRLVSYELPAYSGVRWDWSRRAWGEIRVPADEEEEARLILQDFRQAVVRNPESAEDAGDDGVALVDEESDALLAEAEWRLAEEDAPGREPTAGRRAVRLVHLCPVRDLAEGAMWSGALRSQNLHAVLIAPALRGGGPGWPVGAAGEIRVPTDEVLEARVVLDDYRRAARDAPPPAEGEAPAEGA
jgi:hypothetical protein